MNIELTLHQHSVDDLNFQRLHIENNAEGGILSPDDLKDIKLPSGLTWTKGVVLEGRAPVWVYAALVHECHPAPWVATYDSRLGGIVVSTHSKEFEVSRRIPFEV